MLISARNGRDPKRRARDRGSAQSRVGVSHVGIPGKSGLNSLTMRSPAMAIATRFQITPRSLWWSQWFPCSAKRLTTPPKLQSPVTKIPVVLRRSLFYRLTSSRSHPTLAKDCERVKRIQTERGTTEIFYATRGVHWINKKNHDKIRGVNHSQLTLPFKNVHT